MPMDSAFADGAQATAGQYIAIGGANANDGTWDRNTRTYYKYFTGSDNKQHKYIYTQVKGYGSFWVRDGYTIDITEDPRFGGSGAGNPDKEIIINAYKGEGADSNGLVQSYQNVQESLHMNTLNGDKLFSTNTAIYGGAVNTSSTQVTRNEEYIINEGKTAVNSKNIGQYFHTAEYNEKTGLYSYNGKVVNNENLYVIDGQVGVFTTTSTGNEVYTGDVYGRNNEILMTGVKENGDYVSYWGAEVVDQNAPIGSMTMGTLQGKFDEVNKSIEKIHKDDIKQIQVASATNGGTIGLQTNGEFNEDGTAKGGANVPGTITVTSEGGTGGSGKANDVKIKFASENGGSFTVDAGSKVEATEFEDGKVSKLSINGEDYAIGGGETYSAGDGIAIESDKNNKISVNKGEGLKFVDDGNGGQKLVVQAADGLAFKGNALKVNTAEDGFKFVENEDKTSSKLALNTGDGLHFENHELTTDLKVIADSDATKKNTNGGNWTITDNNGTPDKTSDDVTLTNTTLVDGTAAKESSTNGYGNTYKVTDTDGNTATLEDVASATKLSSVDSKVGDTQYTSTNYIANGQNLTTAASNLDSAIKGNENKIGALDGRVVNVENDTITGGSIDTYGKINLRQKDGTSITTDNAIHDWKVTDANLDENGTLTLNTENAYGGDTGEVTVNNVASTGYVTKQINANNTIITEQYEDYFNENDKYLNSATFDNQSGKLKLTVAKAGDNGQAKEYEVDLSEYVTENDVYVNAISVDKDHHKLILNRNNATQLELGLEELSDIGVSSTDYQLVANPTNGSGGKYTVDDNGTLTLTVKDLNNPNAAAKEIKITGLAKKTDVAVVHDSDNSLRDTKAQIWDERDPKNTTEKSSSIALGNGAFVSVQDGRKGNAILFGSDTYTGGIAIGQDSKALNGTVNIGVKDYTGKMGDVIVGDPNNRDLDNGEYNTYTAMGVGETSVGSNSYISGSLSTNIGSYNVITTKYMNGGNSLDSAQNFGSITVGTLNSIESNSSDSSMLDTIFGKVSGVANSVIGMANKTQNSNGSLVFGTGNEITNSIDTIPTPSSVSGDVADVAKNFRDAVSNRNKSNGGAVLAIGGGNKADYAQNSQLIGVQNKVTGTSKDISEFNMVNGYQNTVTNGSNDTVIGTKNTVTNGDSNVVLGDNHTVQDANNNVILGSSDKETTHTASDTVVIGHNAQANGNNDVAIGSGSIANGAVGIEGYAGAKPIGTVSVGSEGNERTITNVAAGRINEDSTDAVNGSQLYATNQKVDAGWKATAGENSIDVKPTEDGVVPTLNFAGDDKNITVTADTDENAIQVELNKDISVENVTASKDVSTAKYSLNTIGENTQKISYLGGKTVVSGPLVATTIENTSGKFRVDSNGNVASGNVIISAGSGTITGLTNKDWDGSTDNPSRAATEGQLESVSDKVNAGWTATAGETSIEVKPTKDEDGNNVVPTLNFAGDRNIDVTADKASSTINVSLKDNVVLGGKASNDPRVQIGGTNGTIMATKNPNSISATTTIDGGNIYVGSSVSVGANDDVVITDKNITGLSNTTWDEDVKNAVSDSVKGEDKTEATKAATQAQLLEATDNISSDVDNLNDFAVKYDKNSNGTVNKGSITLAGGEDGTQIHNLADGELSATSKDAVNGSQLYAVDQKVNAGWTAKVGDSEINVRPNGENETGKDTLSFAGDDNITVTADAENNAINVKLNPDLTLAGDEKGNSIKLSGTDGYAQVVQGNTYTDIQGGTVTVGSDVNGVNKKIVINGTTGEMTGLSNTTVDYEGFATEGKAATEEQLKQVAVASKTTISNGTNTTVKSTTDSTDGHVDYQVNLNDNVYLGGDNTPENSNIKLDGENGVIGIGSTIALDGRNGTATIGGVNIITESDEETGKPVSIINASGDVTTPNADGTKNYSLKEIGKNTQAIYGVEDGKGSYITTVTGLLAATTIQNTSGEFRVDEKGNVRAGDVVISAVGDIRGLKNTKWDPDNVVENRAATEGQLQQVSNDVDAGWVATDKNGNQVNVNPDNNKLNFAGDDKNITVTAKTDEDGNNSINVELSDNLDVANVKASGDVVTTDEKGEVKYSLNKIGENTQAITGFDTGKGYITTVTGSLVVDELRNKNGEFRVDEKGNVRAGDVVISAVGDIRGLKNTKWDPDNVVENRAATEGQLKDVSDTVNAGWIATDSQNHEVNITPDKNKLNFAGDENITVTAANNEIKTTLNDNITLGEGANQIQLNGDPEANDPALSVGNKFVVEQDGSLTAQTENSKIALGETQASIKVGDNFVDVNNTNVSIEGNQTRVDIGENGAEFRYGNEDVWGYTEIKGGQILTDKVVANDSMIIGDVSTGNYINIDGTTNTITGLSNTTWDDELAKQVANSEELQGTAATQGQLQQAVNEVAEVANAGWNAKAGGNTINVKPNETLNFEGDGNITVSATSGTSSELKFGLNDNITLGDKAGQKTSTSLTLYTDPTPKDVTVTGENGPETVKVTGYIPESYIDDQERVDNFISTHGGFLMYATNVSGQGVFGVTTDGMVHAKDVISYMPNPDSSSNDKILKYSLNDIGDIVTQIAHSTFTTADGANMEYTLVSDFADVEDKDKPFQTENGERSIGLAVRQDGAVIVGAVVDENGVVSGENGIRINDNRSTGGGKDTITGLSNTEWKPPTSAQSMISFYDTDTDDAANKAKIEASKAATQGQLNDLYSTVAAYDVKADGTVDYNHITLAGDPYGYGTSRSANGTPTGGTSITNVAYASGTVGSEAVNVDYLNDAIKDAVKDGPVAGNEKHLDTSTSYTPNEKGEIAIDELDGTGNKTGNQLVINNVASKDDIKDLNDKVGNVDFSGTNHIDKDTDNLTDAIKDLDSAISDMQGDVTQQVEDNTVSGGHVDKDGNVVLETNKDKNIQTDIKLTDSEVVGGKAENGKLTINKKDNYTGAETSIDIEGVATTDMIGAKDKEDLASKYKDADKDGNATTEYITDSESMVEADVALDHAIQDVANTSYANDMVLSNRIDSVEKRLGNVEERIDKVGAMAAAIANLRTMGFDPEAPTEIAIGVGQYKSETGIAIGVFHYPNQDFMLSASLSSSGDELMGGIGATWKLGRKSAAERAKDEEARHLEQAEEMKKLAQQEKVKAQAQRHAKLLAERQQASQKNA